MLRTPLLHPELVAGLARCGHGSQVLIADALFPHATGADAAVPRVYLNLAPGLISAELIVERIAQVVEIESCAYMDSPDGASAPVRQYQQLLAEHRHGGGQAITWSSLERFAFYEACWSRDVGLMVVSGDVRPYANLMLTIGVP